jgi:hypothetical protein
MAPRHSRARSWILPLLLLLRVAPAAAQGQVSITFQVNDAMVKNKVLPGVSIGIARTKKGEQVTGGETDAAGQLKTRLAPGKYYVTYQLDGYVPIERTPTEVSGTAQVITTTLSMMMESVGQADRRRIQIVLNWGSRPEQVKDADSHVVCACDGADPHVFFSTASHRAAGHSAALDVDDTDWGGPETITLRSPAPGSYVYWVHNYSGPPATLGTSDVVVRVVIGTEEAGEFPILKGVTRRAWRPFKTIEVSKDGRPTLVRFTEEEIAEGADLAIPGNLQPDAAQDTSTPDGANPLEGLGGVPIPVLVVFAVMALIVVSRILRAITRAAREQGRRR